MDTLPGTSTNVSGGIYLPTLNPPIDVCLAEKPYTGLMRFYVLSPSRYQIRGTLGPVDGSMWNYVSAGDPVHVLPQVHVPVPALDGH